MVLAKFGRVYEGEEGAVKCITFNQPVTSEKIMKVSCTDCGVRVVNCWM